MEGVGWLEVMKWQEDFVKNCQMASLSAIFSFTYHTIHSPKSTAQPHHQPVAWWFIDGGLLVQGRWNYLKTYQYSLTSSKPQKWSHCKSSLGNFQHRHLLTLLVNVYNYWVMVKSMFCCYLHGSWIFSNPSSHILTFSQCLAFYNCYMYMSIVDWSSASLQTVLIAFQSLQPYHVGLNIWRI